MDIHRCRFVPYRPQAINALAFSHRSNTKQKLPRDIRLAIGRENGDVEIWNPIAGNWVQEKVLRGSRDRTVEQLAWTQDLLVDERNTDNEFEGGPLRLFSSGGSPSITEWDLVTGLQKGYAEVSTADIWCFAAQPQWIPSGKINELNKVASAPSQLLAAGCSDGSVILFTTADESLQYLRILSPASGKKSKVISITWRDRNTVVAGYEEGVIRVIDVPTRSVMRTMSLGKAIDGGSSVVWTLKCLADGTVLSGDSSGELKIWDRKNLSLTQRLKTHDADILDIATSTNGDTIFTTGVDRRVVTYRQIPMQAGNSRDRWQRITHRRFHQHDVKAIASFEAKDISVLVTGGMDTVPIVMPLRNWETEYHRSLPHLPQIPQMSCSTSSRLMLTWWDRELLIWNLPKPSDLVSQEQSTSDILNHHQLLARIELKDDENITSAKISDDGTMIIAATSAGVKLFQVRKRVHNSRGEIRTRLIELPQGIRAFGASSVGFSPNDKWLFAVRNTNLICMVKITPGVSSRDKPQLHQQIVKLSQKPQKSSRVQKQKLGRYLDAIHCVAFSSDSRILATGDLSGRIDTWILEGHEDLQEMVVDEKRPLSDTSSDSDSDSNSDDESDSRVIHGQKWIRNPSGSRLPQLDSAILALSFKPQIVSASSQEPVLGLHATRHNPHPVSHELPPPDTQLVAVSASHQLLEFDVMSSKLSEWSRRNPSILLPQSFRQIKDRVMGIFWDTHNLLNRKRLWLYGHTWLFMLDMNCDLNTDDMPSKVGQLGQYDVREPSTKGITIQRATDGTVSLQRNKKRKRNTGAGDEKRPDEALTSSRGPRKADVMEIDTGLLSPTSDNGDEDIDTEEGGTLTKFRRGDRSTKISNENSLEATVNVNTDVSESTDGSNQAPPYHTIFRYRSIFGISALHSGPDLTSDVDDHTDSREGEAIEQQGLLLHSHSTSKADHGPNLEIVLVERPMYDVDLLPRFDGGQDWST